MKLVGRFILCVLCVSVLGCTAAELATRPPNIIYVIGDGMGFEYVSAYRYFGNKSTAAITDRTLFDAWLVGSVSTSSVDLHAVTDSAASGTALASGIKTHNGVIGLDVEKVPHETVLERAKKAGYMTGMVVTSQINHATPASFAAHTLSRNSYNKIANQYFDRRYNAKPFVDLLVGGGQKYFIRKDRNLVEEFVAEGYQYADTLAAFKRLQSLPVLALLANDGMPHAIDSAEPARLAQMTEKALQLLNTDKPFFLLVEASQIDWCGHANDIACAMAEMADAAKTLAVIERFIQRNPNTLIVMTADHSTGGLSMGANGQYQWRPDLVAKIKASKNKIAQQLLANPEQWLQSWMALTQLSLNEKEKGEMAALVQTTEPTQVVKRLRKYVNRMINRKTFTGWTTGGHTGGDVPLMAYGKQRQRFSGNMDNTEIAQRLFEIIP